MSDENYGSIEKAISGDYEFSIGETLKEAWTRTSGAKGTIQLAIFFYFIAAVGTIMLLSGTSIMIAGSSEEADMNPILQLGIQVAQNLVLLPLGMGIAIIGIKRSADAPISADTIFDYFSKTFSLLITMILMYIMIGIGLVLLVIPGIYLMIAYYMAMPLVAEKGLSPWRALETSRKAMTHRWFSFFGFAFVLGIIVTISAIPLGIGTIWTIPMMIIAFGILYRNMFGIESETIA